MPATPTNHINPVKTVQNDEIEEHQTDVNTNTHTELVHKAQTLSLQLLEKSKLALMSTDLQIKDLPKEVRYQILSYLTLNEFNIHSAKTFYKLFGLTLYEWLCCITKP